MGPRSACYCLTLYLGGKGPGDFRYTGTHFVAQAGLEPAISYLSLPSVGVTGTPHHTTPTLTETSFEKTTLATDPHSYPTGILERDWAARLASFPSWVFSQVPAMGYLRRATPARRRDDGKLGWVEAAKQMFHSAWIMGSFGPGEHGG